MEDKTILLVDNDFYTKIDFWEAFGDEYTIHTLTNGLEAYRWLLQGNRPDVIVVEFNLQGYSGLNLLEHIRAHEQLKTIPFIFISSDNLKKNTEKARRLGANDLYSRPLNFTRLRTRVDTLVRLTNEKVVVQSSSPTVYPSLSDKVERVIATLLFLVLSPLFVLVAALIKLDSRGPVFAVSDKIGRGFRKIKDYRFRTEKWQRELNEIVRTELEFGPDENVQACEMCEKSGVFCSPLLYINSKSICERAYYQWKQERMKRELEQPRETTIGKWLRWTGIEILPNLINVIKGDMSFRGRAALFPEIAETLTTDATMEKIMSPVGMFNTAKLQDRRLKSFMHTN